MIRKNILIISSVSGGGKNTIINELKKRFPGLFITAVTTTTRKPRENEVHGIHYYFLSRDEFESKIRENQFIEFAIVHGNYYGIPISEIEKAKNNSKILILNIDYQGMRTVKNKFPDVVLSIFLLPPDEHTWLERLTGRSTESKEEIEIRIKDGIKEIHVSNEYDYKVVNDEIDRCVNEIIDVLKKEKMITNYE